MTGREQLELVRKKQKTIDTKQLKLNELKARACSTRPASYSNARVHTSHSIDNLEKLIIKYNELEQEILRDRLELFFYRDELLDKLFNLTDVTELNYLGYRYIWLEPLKNIPKLIGVSEDYAKHLNARALKSFEELLEDAC